jgi:uncharacterized protein
VEPIPRLVETYVGDVLLPAFPALLVTGARAVGKTTSMHLLTRTHLDLSVPAVRDSVSADPDAALDGLDEPVLIDEWQEVPDVVSAVKRSVDRSPRPGRYILTGSVRGPLTTGTWGGTGRLIRVSMFGLSQAEIAGTAVNPIDLAFTAPGELTTTGPVDLDRNGYLERLVAGGFPASFRLPDRPRSIWFRSYVQEVIDRDAVAVGGIREPAKLRAVLNVVAARTAQEQQLERMCTEAGVARSTLSSHLDLLENLQLLIRLPAWTPNRLRRLVRAPKLHLTDSGLTAALLGTSARAARLDGPLAGALMETFVVGELLKAATVAETLVDLHHLRTQDGYEVDVMAVANDGRVVGFEVKSAARVAAGDGRGLRWLRDRLGDAFVAGYVLHTGPLSHRIDDRLWAVPAAALWQPPAGSDHAGG